MGRIPPRFDDKDEERHLEKALAGGQRSERSANAILTTVRPYIETGRKIKEAAKRGGKEGGKQRQDERAENYKKWQAEAVSIWLKNPKLSKVAVARIIFRRLNESDRKKTCVRTIRAHIKHPDETL